MGSFNLQSEVWRYGTGQLPGQTYMKEFPEQAVQPRSPRS
jgi:hypothetical protein